MLFLAALVVWGFLAKFVYAPAGAITPEAHAHDGYVTVPGWLHVFYAALASWIIARAFLPGMMEPALTASELVVFLGGLSIWAVLGVVKFNPYWTCGYIVTLQVAGEVFAFVTATFWRVYRLTQN